MYSLLELSGMWLQEATYLPFISLSRVNKSLAVLPSFPPEDVLVVDQTSTVCTFPAIRLRID
jgi:hypothetical protein